MPHRPSRRRRGDPEGDHRDGDGSSSSDVFDHLFNHSEIALAIRISSASDQDGREGQQNRRSGQQ